MWTRLCQVLLSFLTIGCLASACPPKILLTSSTIGPFVAVAQIKTLRNGKKRMGAKGSGTVIGHKNGRTYILTVRHAIEGDDGPFKIGIWTNEAASPIEARLERISKYGLDAAIISIKAIDYPIAKISKRNPSRRERIIVLGSPLGKFRYSYYRRIEGYDRKRFRSGLRYQRKSFLLNGEVPKGFSGGGVYNEQEELIGVFYARRVTENNKGVCIPIRALNELIKPYI